MDTLQFEDAVARLAEMMRQYDSSDQLDSVLKDAVKESLIQRFEYTHEMAWKTAKRYLVEVEGYQNDLGPNTVIRLCGELGLLNAEPWLAYAHARQSTSHDYSGQKASIAVEAVEEFYADAVKFLSALKKGIAKGSRKSA